MPYITQEGRKELAPLIDPLLDAIQEVPANFSKGDINYLITRIVARRYANGGYEHRTKGSGVFLDALLEYVRRVINGYEDRKIFENGDIPEYIKADRE